MRLWLKDAERQPDPTPVKTDDRLAILVGLALWLVALVTLWLFGPNLFTDRLALAFGVVFVALALGVIGLIYIHIKRR